MSRGDGRIVLWTSLRLDECERRMHQRCEPILFGRIDARGFTIRKMERAGGARLEGRWSRKGGATRIEVRGRPDWDRWVVLGAWLGYVGAFAVLASWVAPQTKYRELFVMAAPAWAMVLFALFVAWRAHETRAAEIDELTSLVRQTLDAAEDESLLDLPSAGYRETAARRVPRT